MICCALQVHEFSHTISRMFVWSTVWILAYDVFFLSLPDTFDISYKHPIWITPVGLFWKFLWYLFKPSLYWSKRKYLFRERHLKIYVCLWVTKCCHSSLHTNKIGHSSTVTDCYQLFKKRYHIKLQSNLLKFIIYE